MNADTIRTILRRLAELGIESTEDEVRKALLDDAGGDMAVASRMALDLAYHDDIIRSWSSTMTQGRPRIRIVTVEVERPSRDIIVVSALVGACMGAMIGMVVGAFFR